MIFDYSSIKSASRGMGKSFYPPAPTSLPIAVPIREGRGNLSAIQNFRDGLGGFRGKSLRDYADGAFSIYGTLTSLWTYAVTTRQDYLLTSAEMRRFYIVEAILRLMKQDVLNADKNGDIVLLKSSDPEMQRELTKFQSMFDLNVWLHNITKDFIDYGEYTLRMEVKEGRGVIGIFDDVNQLNVVSFYENGLPKRFLLWEDNEFRLEPAHTHIHFVDGEDKLRVKLEAQMNAQINLGPSGNFGMSNMPLPTGGVNRRDMETEAFQDLPDYVYIGKPFFYGMIPKLRELQLLEQLIPAAKLNQVTQSTLVAVKVPAATPPEEVTQILRHYEEILNTPTGIDTERMELTLSEVLTASGRTRLVPLFSDDKGALEALNVRASQPIDDLILSVNDLRKVICSSLGIPASLIFGPADGSEQSKAQELHLYSRYTRKLASIQQALGRGLKQLALTHLVNIGMRVRVSDVEVVFTNTLIDLAGLERLEFCDAEQDLVMKKVDYLNQILACPILAAGLDKRKALRWFKTASDILTETSIFQDPDKVIFDLAPPGGDPGAAGGGGGMSPMDGLGSSTGGDLPSPVPNNPEAPGGDEPSSPGSGTPSFQARAGAPLAGSQAGQVNISNV